MRDIGIVARVLDDARAGETVSLFMQRQREFWPEAFRQRDGAALGARLRSCGHA
jgi:hypothetical protein